MKKLKYVAPLVAGLIAVSFGGCSLAPQTAHEVTFLNKSCIEPLSNYTYQTCNNLNVMVDKKEVVVPKGFKTDLASIPKWYWSIIAPHSSEYIAPSILHDYFYRCDTKETRLYADEVFYYALRAKDVSPYNAGKFYAAVRVFGKSSYHVPGACKIG